MARHSKWNNIKHHKAAADKKRGKVFTKHAKLIAVTARGGADPDLNPLLRMAIDNARAVRVPNENIERAIRKGSGEGKDAAVFEEIVYEGFGPGGVALLIEVLTDNRNRAFGNLKTTMGKRGGRVAENGAVAWMFQKIGEIILKVPAGGVEELELAAIDLGADDVEVGEEENPGVSLVKITCSPENLGRMRLELSSKGYQIDSSQMTFVAGNKVTLEEGSTEMAELDRLIECIEVDDDVCEVYTNLE